MVETLVNENKLECI